MFYLLVRLAPVLFLVVVDVVVVVVLLLFLRLLPRVVRLLPHLLRLLLPCPLRLLTLCLVLRRPLRFLILRLIKPYRALLGENRFWSDLVIEIVLSLYDRKNFIPFFYVITYG